MGSKECNPHLIIHGLGCIGLIPCNLSTEKWKRKHTEVLSFPWALEQTKKWLSLGEYALSFLLTSAHGRWLLLFS